MKSLIWKELRENLKWAILAMLALGLAEFYCLLHAGDSYDESAATLCKSAFLTATTFGNAVAGIILGLIQILPEQKRDQWAALLHRPVTRGTIFRGKALAGIFLYFLAAVPPFLACVWYVATPGHYAVPFLAPMVLPGIADICAGSMFYLAALFVGVWRGPWYGARVFGFLAAILGSAFTGSSKFSVALVMVVVVAVILFTAGWGAIFTNGRLRDQPWLGRFASVLVVLSGALIALAFGVGLLFMFASSPPYYSTTYNVDLEGKPLIFINTKDQGLKVTDLAGTPVLDKRFTQGSSSNLLLSFTSVTSFIGAQSRKEASDREYSLGYRNNRSYVVSASGACDRYTENWYYLPEEHQFVGYFFKAKQRIGSIGLDGFHPGSASSAPFPKGTSQIMYQVNDFVQFGSTVYHNDFDLRKLTPVFSGEGQEIFGVNPMESSQDRNLDQNWAAVGLRDKIVIVDKTGQVIATLPYHQDVRRWGAISVAVMPDKTHFFLQYTPSLGIDSKVRITMPSFYEEMDAKGTLLQTYTLPPTEPHDYPHGWQEYVMACLPPPVILYGYLAYAKIGAMAGSESLQNTWKDLTGDGWVYLGTFLLLSSITSVVLTLVTIVWTRRLNFSWSRTWAWALLVLAFNIAGFITFRLIADWPIRVPCPQCSRKRPVEETLCPHCHATWPTPKPNGIEILDEKVPVAHTVA